MSANLTTIFYFDDMPQMTNPSYPLAGLITHLGFGLLLVPFFLTSASRTAGRT